MKNKLRICPRCEWTKEMIEKELLKLQDYIDRIPEEDKVEEEEYERRLRICDGCGELRSGLCGQCGCYVAVRAARKNGYCPHVREKWNQKKKQRGDGNDGFYGGSAEGGL